MSMGAKQEAVEALWRRALSDYRRGIAGAPVRGVAGRPQRQRSDRVRVSADIPAGLRRSTLRRVGTRIVLVGQNPGEGSDPASVEMDREYRAKLDAFTRGDTTFKDLNRLIASHMLS
jgi:hypothetical protein